MAERADQQRRAAAPVGIGGTTDVPSEPAVRLVAEEFVEDLAIGAPWHRRETADRVGRVELRSARTGKVLTELFGDEADCWFGWHIRRAPDPDGHGRPALLISSLRHPVNGKVGVGVLDLYVLRRAKVQGTTTRGTRRSDIR